MSNITPVMVTTENVQSGLVSHAVGHPKTVTTDDGRVLSVFRWAPVAETGDCVKVTIEAFVRIPIDD